jgi:hypothetical protein
MYADKGDVEEGTSYLSILAKVRRSFVLLTWVRKTHELVQCTRPSAYAWSSGRGCL